MYLLCALEELTKCSYIWERQATPLGLWWWVLGRQEPRTEENESGLWPTPQAADGDGGKGPRKGMSETGRMPDGSKATVNLRARVVIDQESAMPTPHANCRNGAGRHGTGGPNLQTAVQESAMPTPSARDWKNGQASQETLERNSRPLNEVVISGPPAPQSLNTHGSSRGSLNPRWVLQLQGYPEDWLDVGEWKP